MDKRVIVQFFRVCHLAIDDPSFLQGFPDGDRVAVVKTVLFFFGIEPVLLNQLCKPCLLYTSSVSAWYAEDGIHLSHGKSVRYDRSAQVISWESAAERIGELLESGQFASNVELAEAAGYERSLLSEKLWYLYHDLSEGCLLYTSRCV